MPLFNDIAGTLTVQPLEAAQLIKRWFDPTDIVVLSGKRVDRIKGANVMSQCLPAWELIADLESDGAADILYSLATEPVPLDLYVNVGTPRQELGGIYKRAKEEDLARVIGIVGDFDVKVGSFDSTQSILDFLSKLPLPPTMVVESGSGGVHAWWKIRHNQPVPTILGKEVGERWWAYLNKVSTEDYRAQIDKISDTARMLRLPGTIHWPRPGSNGVPSSVKLVMCDGPEYTIKQILDASGKAWEERLASRARTREADRKLHLDAQEYASMVSGGRWEQMIAVSSVEQWFTENVAWESILAPAGWTFTRQGAEGRQEWARPGRDDKSAVVGWDESPDVMSLLSTSHDTGLLDLLDAGVPLTKWRVSMRLNFHDDYQSLVRWTLQCMGNTVVE